MRCTLALATALVAATSALAAPFGVQNRYAALAHREAIVHARGNTCKTMPSSVDPKMRDLIYTTVLKRSTDPVVMLVTMVTAYRESMVNNLDCGDQDSLGLFQQRPSQGWGSPDQITDPNYSINKFLDAAIPVINADHDANPGTLAQRIQDAQAGDHYTENLGTARQLIAEAKASVGGDGGDDTPSSTSSEPKPTPSSPATGGGAINTGGDPNDGDDGDCNCTQYYTPQAGDNCYKVSDKFNLKLSEFYDLNPEIDDECQNLYAGKPYCVAAQSS